LQEFISEAKAKIDSINRSGDLQNIGSIKEVKIREELNLVK
jgi:hypothetical protein